MHLSSFRTFALRLIRKYQKGNISFSFHLKKMEKNPFRIYQWFSSLQHCCLLLFSCRSNWKKAWYLSVYSFIRFYQDFIKSILSIVNSKCMNDDYDYCCCCCCWIFSIIIIFFFWKPKDNNNKMKRKSTTIIIILF